MCFILRPTKDLDCNDPSIGISHVLIEYPHRQYRLRHGGYGYGKPDPDSEGERILEYALAYDLFLGNTCFKKRDSHLITYRSGYTATQIDLLLFRKSLRKLVMDVKVIPREEVTL